MFVCKTFPVDAAFSFTTLPSTIICAFNEELSFGPIPLAEIIGVFVDILASLVHSLPKSPVLVTGVSPSY